MALLLSSRRPLMALLSSSQRPLMALLSSSQSFCPSALKSAPPDGTSALKSVPPMVLLFSGRHLQMALLSSSQSFCPSALKSAPPDGASALKSAPPDCASVLKSVLLSFCSQVGAPRWHFCSQVSAPDGASVLRSAPPDGASVLKSVLLSFCSQVSAPRWRFCSEVGAPDGASVLRSAPPEGASELSSAPPEGASELSSAPPEGASTLKLAPPEGASGSSSAPFDGASGLKSVLPDGASGLSSAPISGASGLSSAPIGGASGLSSAPIIGAFELSSAPSDGAAGLLFALPDSACGLLSAACILALLSRLPKDLMNDFKFAPQERPPVVTINPDNHVFIGETVTLTCNIVNGGGVQNWRYRWNKGGSDQTVSNDQQYRISDVTENHAGKYTCTGTETGGSRSSHPSDAVLLTVSAKPKPTVRLEPQNFIYTGDTVTLTCDLNQSTGWNFTWYRNDQHVNLQTSADKITTNKLSVKRFNTGTTTYKCRARRRNEHNNQQNHHYYDSDYSDPVTVAVEERPKAAVIINPSNHVFIDEIVTLTCNIENGGGVQNWTYSWNKEGSDQTVSNDQQYRINKVTENHAGKYTCTGTETGGSRSSHPSDAVLLTVSAKPKPTVRSEPQKFIYTGDTVTLTCDLNQSTGWTFIWNKNNQHLNPQISADKITTNKLSEKLSNTGTTKYYCVARRENYYSQFSDPVTVTVEARPKPVVTIEPGHVFSGDSVTLTCNINGGRVQNWTYSWKKEGSNVSNKQQYRISDVKLNHAGKYTCTGTETGGSRSSHPSDAVLTVSERPKPAVTTKPDNHVFIGEIVTLRCNIVNGGEKPKPELTSNHKVAALAGNLVLLYCELNPTAGWNFYWYKHTQNTETETTTHPSYTIYSVSVSDGGQYWCRAGRGNPVYYTHYSNALWVNVTGETSPVSLIINPSRTQHFTDESLSLSCVDQSKSTEWRVKSSVQKNDDRGVLDCSTLSGSAGESTCSISSLSTSHTGVYWCESESGGSNPVNITVHGGDVILESPVNPVIEGESLTLHCLYRKTKPSNLRADFYKDGSVVQNQTSGEMMIHQVSKSDEGFYHCKYPEGGESPKSLVLVRGDTDISKSVATIIGVAGGLGSALLLLLLIILLCCCKRNKGLILMIYD
ncbi:Fc receptor-like protein 5 [Trichomycterus rosablanca]|uniref:Fc receptor-like protein 5 n=1 Tax=Trichomycterus rosablanca TaxID=2290929 RepID=UPI002F35895B